MKASDILLLGAFGFLGWYVYSTYLQSPTSSVVVLQSKAPSQAPAYIAAGAGAASAAASVISLF
jgi:hypothetical protein